MPFSHPDAAGPEKRPPGRAWGRLRLSPDTAWKAAGWYVLVTLVLTWPLARGLASDIPADTGDSLLNCWILAWGAEHVLRLAGGNLGAFAGYWDGNFFHPASLTVAYSEHMLPQALQIAPVYALTGNIILCYNLVFLSTFVLCGLGTFLLVRELTGDWRAAFAAGLFFAFTPYRIAQFPHVQVLSIQWMPFALYALTRFARTGGLLPLAGFSLALLAQNLSCGYFLMYFAPFAAAYGVWAIARWRQDGKARALASLALAFLVVGGLTVPFVLPYLELRALGFPPRPIEEVTVFSADVRSYLSGPPTSNGTARLFQVFPKPEGELFLGLVPMALALAAAVLAWRDARRERRSEGPSGYGFWKLRVPARAGRGISVLLLAAIAVELGAAVFMIVEGPQVFRVGGTTVRLREVGRLVWNAGLAALLLFAWSARARANLRRLASSPSAFWVAAAVVAGVLSLGPVLRSAGAPLGDGPYRLLYDHVPGFDGIRVPSRLALQVALFVAVLAGLALARIRVRVLVWALALAFLVEVWPPPILINYTDPVEQAVTPPSPVPYGDRTPPVYAYLARLPAETVILEMPFGREGYELRYVFYSTRHWRPLVNGYSGGLPDQYYRLTLSLGHPVANWDRAWQALHGSTATVVVVHEAAYLGDKGPRVSGWLEAHGARRIATFGQDVVFELPAKDRGLASPGGRDVDGRRQ